MQGAAARQYNPALRLFWQVYRPGSLTPCPGCDRANWLVGRVMAECAFCHTALPLAESSGTGIKGGIT
jgi:hypothetical protein